MANTFNSAASPLSEAEQALTRWGVEYKRNPDGTLVVYGALDISNRDLTRLPDLSSVSVLGLFSCSNNFLTSLEGSPRYVEGSYYCHNNQITSLKGGPDTIIHNFQCYNNRLTSLEGAPKTVRGFFYCQGNQLASLEYAPKGFFKLESDFGDYHTVPDELRLSPEKRAQALAYGATVLQAPLQVRRPLTFR
ncbi:MAG: hypothetical protein ACAH83_00835 [Alphaproteobacteria bacterium]